MKRKQMKKNHGSEKLFFISNFEDKNGNYMCMSRGASSMFRFQSSVVRERKLRGCRLKRAECQKVI
jgi:hypothetical protein